MVYSKKYIRMSFEFNFMPQNNPQQILKILKRLYPGEKRTALAYRNPLELLVSTILSAQCTDERVNKITKEIFKKYKTAEDYADADVKRFEQEIRSTGFYRNKAKNIINACRMIVKDFNSKVPNSMENLIKLPGVARKTANIVLTNAYGIVEGIAVDTHVKRVSFRLGLTKNTSPEKIERDLMGIYQKKDWEVINYLLVSHGRKVCKAPVPFCSRCVLSGLCPKAGVEKSY